MSYAHEVMNRHCADMLLRLLAMEMGKIPLNEQPEKPLLSEIVEKRIKVLNLPVKFSPYALLAVSLLANNPGGVVVLLIDALNKFEGGEITTAELCKDLYPWGFYSQEALEKRVNEIKERKGKWDHIY